MQIIVFQTIQFSLSTLSKQYTVKTVLIQLVQFSINIDYVYTQLNVKTYMKQFSLL